MEWETEVRGETTTVGIGLAKSMFGLHEGGLCPGSRVPASPNTGSRVLSVEASLIWPRLREETREILAQESQISQK